jgi:transposase
MKTIKELITNAGCKLEYLPPYSPDYNPIEYTFSIIKCYFKKRGGIIGNETTEELGEKAVKIATTVVSSEMARNQFCHCKINMD